jgi:two-component system KDP operon response regulator KdpE
MHILLVEDERHIRSTLVRSITAWGHDVSEAMSVAEATATLDRSPPDLAIVDVNLADGTGWEFLAALRQRSPNAVATIVMSAIRPNRERLDELAPDVVLLKPFPLESLHAAISRLERTPST